MACSLYQSGIGSPQSKRRSSFSWFKLARAIVATTSAALVGGSMACAQTATCGGQTYDPNNQLCLSCGPAASNPTYFVLPRWRNGNTSQPFHWACCGPVEWPNNAVYDTDNQICIYCGTSASNPTYFILPRWRNGNPEQPFHWACCGDPTSPFGRPFDTDNQVCISCGPTGQKGYFILQKYCNGQAIPWVCCADYRVGSAPYNSNNCNCVNEQIIGKDGNPCVNCVTAGGTATGGTATSGTATSGTATSGTATSGTATSGTATGGNNGGLLNGGLTLGGITTGGGILTGGVTTGGNTLGGITNGSTGGGSGGPATGGSVSGVTSGPGGPGGPGGNNEYRAYAQGSGSFGGQSLDDAEGLNYRKAAIAINLAVAGALGGAVLWRRLQSAGS